MGDWLLVISGTGPHDNGKDYDIETLTEEFVLDIGEGMGHTIKNVTLIVGNEKIVRV